VSTARLTPLIWSGVWTVLAPNTILRRLLIRFSGKAYRVRRNPAPSLALRSREVASERAAGDTLTSGSKEEGPPPVPECYSSSLHGQELRCVVLLLGGVGNENDQYDHILGISRFGGRKKTREAFEDHILFC
jgi:hypothetical protein